MEGLEAEMLRIVSKVAAKAPLSSAKRSCPAKPSRRRLSFPPPGSLLSAHADDAVFAPAGGRVSYDGCAHAAGDWHESLLITRPRWLAGCARGTVRRSADL